MTWRQAQEFCELYGGNLPILTDDADFSNFTSKIPSSKMVWLGAGNSIDGQWQWLNSTPLKKQPTSAQGSAYLAIDKQSAIISQAAIKKHPFFIEWNMDGTPPITISESLNHCASTLKSGRPVFPIGTFTQQKNHYLIVRESLDWVSASQKAQLAGGHLAVPSSPDENDWLTDQIKQNVEKGQYCWIGGFRKAKGTWTWINGLPWVFATWSSSAPETSIFSEAGCAVNDSQTWQDFPETTSQNYFIIQWGKKPAVTSSEPTSTPSKKLKSAQIICAKLIKKIHLKYEKEFVRNIKAYENTIRSFQHGLSNKRKEACDPAVEIMTTYTVNNRIPKSIEDTEDQEVEEDVKPKKGSRSNLDFSFKEETEDIVIPAKLIEIFNYYLKKQENIERNQMVEIENLRIKYNKNLLKQIQKFKEKGLKFNIHIFEKEQESTQKAGKSFEDYILNLSF
jgi:hypothetical protein